MKKTLITTMIAACLVITAGCSEAEELAKDATGSFDNLKNGVTEVKENVEGTVNTIQNGVNTVKETAENVGNTVKKVNDATNSVSDLMKNE